VTSMTKGFRSEGWWAVNPGETFTRAYYVEQIEVHMNFNGNLQDVIVPNNHRGKSTIDVHPKNGFKLSQTLIDDNKELGDNWYYYAEGYPVGDQFSPKDFQRKGYVSVTAYKM